MTLDLVALTVEEKVDLLRKWLRHHSEISVELHLWTLYGTMSVEIREWPEGTLLNSDYGMNIGKRLDFAIKKLGIVPESGPQVEAVSATTLTIRRPIRIHR